MIVMACPSRQPMPHIRNPLHLTDTRHTHLCKPAADERQSPHSRQTSESSRAGRLLEWRYPFNLTVARLESLQFDALPGVSGVHYSAILGIRRGEENGFVDRQTTMENMQSEG